MLDSPAMYLRYSCGFYHPSAETEALGEMISHPHDSLGIHAARKFISKYRFNTVDGMEKMIDNPRSVTSLLQFQANQQHFEYLKEQ